MKVVDSILKMNGIVFFIILLWIIVLIALFIIYKIDNSNQSKKLIDSYSKEDKVKKYYNSIFLKIDSQLNKAELVTDMEGKLIHYSKVFDNLLKIICDYLWNASIAFENDDLDKNNFNYIECISEHNIFKKKTIDDLHRARKSFNLIKHDLDCKDVDKNFLIDITNNLYDFVKKIISI